MLLFITSHRMRGGGDDTDGQYSALILCIAVPLQD